MSVLVVRASITLTLYVRRKSVTRRDQSDQTRVQERLKIGLTQKIIRLCLCLCRLRQRPSSAAISLSTACFPRPACRSGGPRGEYAVPVIGTCGGDDNEVAGVEFSSPSLAGSLSSSSSLDPSSSGESKPRVPLSSTFSLRNRPLGISLSRGYH